jgi:tryptophanyl-tRNA synthetase
MSLQDPSKKMSKSDADPKATIFLTDTDQQMAKKIKSAVTDTGSTVRFADDSPGIKNLLTIQSAISGKHPDELVASYEGKMYGHVKADTAELVVGALGPIRDEVQRLMDDRSYLDAILARGAEKARKRASATLLAVKDALGFVQRTSSS